MVSSTRTPPGPVARLRELLDGPLPSLPERLDDLAERWAGASPRARASILALTVVVFLLVAGRGAARSPFGQPLDVVVARTDLAAGHTISADDLSVRAWPGDLAPSAPVTAADQVVGATLASGVAAGQPLAAVHLAGDGLGTLVGPSEVALPVPVPLASEYAPGDRVDVFGGDAGVLLVGDARVLATAGDVLWLALPRSRAGDVAAAARWDQALVALRPG